MKTGLCLSSVMLVLLAGCATNEFIGGIEPVDPKPGGAWNYGNAKVNSLRPTLTWRGTSPASATYDLAIYEATIDHVSGLKPGKEVYYRENLKGTSHTLEIRLLPYCYYAWTVRTRSGTNVSAWATWNRQRIAGSEQGMFWTFKTPGPEAK